MTVIAPAGPPLKVLRNAYLRRLQRRHFFMFDAVPLVSVCMTIPFWNALAPRWFDVALFLIMYVGTGLGVTIGLHRYFTHKSFQTSRLLAAVLAIMGMMAVVGPVLAWVGIHRRHHELSDRAGDPHSPHVHRGHRRLAGIFHAHMGWLVNHEVPNPNHYAKDWLRESWLVRLNRYYVQFAFLGLAIPTLTAYMYEPTLRSALQGLLWGGLIRLCLLHHFVSSVNSICHTFGTRRFQTRERSTNCAVLAIPTLGEAWHNNHHAYQTSATFQHRWWEFDAGHAVICIAEKVGIVWNVRRPRDRRIKEKR